jgi:hypothetical protein
MMTPIEAFALPKPVQRSSTINLGALQSSRNDHLDSKSNLILSLRYPSYSSSSYLDFSLPNDNNNNNNNNLPTTSTATTTTTTTCAIPASTTTMDASLGYRHNGRPVSTDAFPDMVSVYFGFL